MPNEPMRCGSCGAEVTTSPDDPDTIVHADTLLVDCPKGVTRCPKSESGEHEPDPNTLSIADYDPGVMVVDVNCQLCGRSGSVVIEREDVRW